MRRATLFLISGILLCGTTPVVAFDSVPTDVAAELADVSDSRDISQPVSDVSAPESDASQTIKPDVPETPEEADQVLTDLVSAAEKGHWAIVAGLCLMLFIWVLRRVKILTKIPDKAIPWVAAGLAILGYIATGLAQGMVWHVALVQGFLAGASAVGLWEMIFRHYLKVEDEE